MHGQVSDGNATKLGIACLNSNKREITKMKATRNVARRAVAILMMVATFLIIGAPGGSYPGPATEEELRRHEPEKIAMFFLGCGLAWLGWTFYQDIQRGKRGKR
jgi:hypothetical protein